MVDIFSGFVRASRSSSILRRVAVVGLTAMILLLLACASRSGVSGAVSPSAISAQSASGSCQVNDVDPRSSGRDSHMCADSVPRLLDELTPHEPIDITDVSNFTSLGFAGTGTESDPFLIYGLEIESYDMPCISIKGDFSAYYSIEGCRVFGSQAGEYWDMKAAIYLEAGNGTVRGCQVLNATYGITLAGGDKELYSTTVWNCNHETLTIRDTFDFSVKDCVFLGLVSFSQCGSITLENSTLSGIQAFSASNIVFEDCTLGSAVNAFFYCSDCYLWNCTVPGHDGGVLTLEHSEKTQVISSVLAVELRVGPESVVNGCRIDSRVDGIIARGDDVFLENNVIMGSGSGIGVNVLHGKDGLVVNNSVAGFNVGFYVSSEDYTFTQNVITYCVAGILAAGSENRFYLNYMSGNGIDAQDDGHANQWDNGYGTGNYYGWRPMLGPYIIPGTAGSVDRYPINAGIAGPLVIFGVPLLVGVVALLLASGGRLKWPARLTVSEDERAKWTGRSMLRIYLTGLPYTVIALGAAFVGAQALRHMSLVFAAALAGTLAMILIYGSGLLLQGLLSGLWKSTDSSGGITGNPYGNRSWRFMVVLLLSYALVHYFVFSGLVPDVFAVILLLPLLVGWTLFIGQQVKTSCFPEPSMRPLQTGTA